MSSPAAALVVEIPFVKRVGLTADAAGGGLHLPDDPTYCNHVGTVHAGALFTLGESASGVAVIEGLLPHVEGAMPVARNASISYRKPARGSLHAAGTLAEPAEAILARLGRDGKANFEVNVVLKDDAGVEVALMKVEWHLRQA